LQVVHPREIILGDAADVFVRSDAVNAPNLHIDQQLMDAVGHIDITTLTPQERESRKHCGPNAAE